MQNGLRTPGMLTSEYEIRTSRHMRFPVWSMRYGGNFPCSVVTFVLESISCIYLLFTYLPAINYSTFVSPFCVSWQTSVFLRLFFSRKPPQHTFSPVLRSITVCGIEELFRFLFFILLLFSCRKNIYLIFYKNIMK